MWRPSVKKNGLQREAKKGCLVLVCLDHKLIISRLKTDSFDFFFHGLFALEYADSSNQCDFFLYDSLVLRLCPIKSVKYA